MAYEEDVATGLLSWINSLDITDPIDSIDDLATGKILWKVLRAGKFTTACSP